MKIRIFVNWAAAICCILLLTACPKDSVPEVTMTVSASDVTLDSNNEATIRVTSNGKWTVTPRADWLTPYPSSGTGNRDVTIRGNENTGTETRTGRISIVDETGQNEITVTVRQNPKSTPTPGNQPSINKTSMSFNADGGDESFELTTNSSWTSQCEGWITLNPMSGNGSKTVIVHVDSNPNTESRNGKITVTTSGSTFTISVTQKGKDSAYYVNVSTSRISFANNGGSDSFTIETNDECDIKQTSGTNSWLTVTPSGKTINVTATANESTIKREAVITVTGRNSGLFKEVKVTQSANSYTFDVSTDKLNFSASSSSQTIKVTGNDSWTAESDKSWCTVPPTGSEDINVTVLANNDPNVRTAEITIKGVNTGNSFIVNVTQSGTGFEFGISGTTSLQFDASANNKTVTITGNDTWSASTSEPSWCTVSPSYGQGSRNISVSVTDNTGTTDREATITLSGSNSGKDIYLSVKQYGTNPSLKADISKTDFASSAGDEATLTITSNASWTVSVTGGDWLSVTPTNGTGNKTVVIKTTKANTSSSQRSATITVSGSSTERSFTVTQAPANATLTVSPQSLDFEATGGKATATVSSNEQWSISNKPDWCTTNVTVNSVTITVGQNNTREKRTGKVLIKTSSGKEATISLTQKANSISVNPYGNDENWDNK